MSTRLPLISSPEQYLLKGTNRETPHNAIFSTLLPLPRAQVDPQMFLTTPFSEAPCVRFEVLIWMAVKTAFRWHAILHGCVDFFYDIYIFNCSWVVTRWQ